MGETDQVKEMSNPQQTSHEVETRTAEALCVHRTLQKSKEARLKQSMRVDKLEMQPDHASTQLI